MRSNAMFDMCHAKIIRKKHLPLFCRRVPQLLGWEVLNTCGLQCTKRSPHAQKKESSYEFLFERAAEESEDDGAISFAYVCGAQPTNYAFATSRFHVLKRLRNASGCAT